VSLLAATPLVAQLRIRLSPITGAEYNEYVKRAEAAMDWRARLEVPTDGTIVFAPGSGVGTTDINGGIIHDWAAAAIAPVVGMEQVLGVFQDYDAYKTRFSPNVRDSKLLSRDGNHWHVYMRLYKKKILSVLLDTEHDIEYRPLGGGRWAIISPAVKIAEVEDGKPMPEGVGHGFLWRLNSYWLLEPRPGGVYMECRAISMSRDVPTGLGWAVKPMLTTVPRESLAETLRDTLRALR
jgi:hypothetical protein